MYIVKASESDHPSADLPHSPTEEAEREDEAAGRREAQSPRRRGTIAGVRVRLRRKKLRKRGSEREWKVTAQPFV